MKKNPTELARALSKLGYCSRTAAAQLIKAGRVTVDDKVVTDPQQMVLLADVSLRVDGETVRAPQRIYLALNKPRGLVTTTVDERGRATVYECFKGADLPLTHPVGRLDKGSEGLLLLTNDNVWAANILDPVQHIPKTYHVQIDCVANETLIERIAAGVRDEGELLRVSAVHLLRAGAKNSWLEIVLDEGKNRHIRRILDVCGVEVLRLIRIQIGGLALGELKKGEWRHLTPLEVRQLSR